MQTMKRLLYAYVRVVQKVLITTSLFLLYVFGFGGTLLLVIIMRPGFLSGGRENGGTFWRKAEGYTHTMEDCARES